MSGLATWVRDWLRDGGRPVSLPLKATWVLSWLRDTCEKPANAWLLLVDVIDWLSRPIMGRGGADGGP